MKEIGQRIIKQVKKGNGDAFEKIVQHYHQSIYQICYMMMGNQKNAEELASDTFLYAYEHMEEYSPTDQKFSLWLFQSSITLAEERLDTEEMTKSDTKEVCSILRQCPKEDMQALLMNISFRERLALILNSSNQLTVQEISEVLDIPRPEILTYLRQGRETLREKLRQYSV